MVLFLYHHEFYLNIHPVNWPNGISWFKENYKCLSSTLEAQFSFIEFISTCAECCDGIWCYFSFLCYASLNPALQASLRVPCAWSGDRRQSGMSTIVTSGYKSGIGSSSLYLCRDIATTLQQLYNTSNTSKNSFSKLLRCCSHLCYL